MQLTVPQRTVADASSFPIDPEGVNRWLAKLSPTKSVSDAMEVYRGLRHSNRLHNDLTRRRAVIACFIPTLRELCDSLQDICQAQPLPLTTEFQRSAQLLDGLLREEAFAFKILLADSPQPRGADLLRAMKALAFQAEARIHCYKDVSEALLRDAHQLYSLAEEFSLLDAIIEEDQPSTFDFYRYILLLTLADSHQHRARQITPLLAFLKTHASQIRVLSKMPADPSRIGTYALHLQHGARPVPANALLFESTKDIRWFSLSTVLTRIDARLAHSNTQQTALLGSETLDRQSFARLRVTLDGSRRRRGNRVVRSEPKVVMLGHKAICAHMHLAAAKAASLQAEIATDDLASSYEAMDRASEYTDMQDEQNWVLINQSKQGAALVNHNCRAGTVQVGDLISVQSFDDDATASKAGRSNAFVGVIRWVAATEGNGVRIGMEFLAKGVLPVGLARANTADFIADDALIVACKVQNKVLQTILLPAYLYQNNDRLTVALNGKSRQVKLNEQLQSNGLFSHFSLLDVETAVKS